MKGRKEGKQMEEARTRKMNFDYFIVIRQFLVIFPQKPDKPKPVVVFIVHPMYFCLVLFSQWWKYFYTCQKPSGVHRFSRGVGAPSNISQCIQEPSTFPLCSVTDLLG